MTTIRVARRLELHSGAWEWTLGLGSLALLIWLVGSGRVSPLGVLMLELFLAF